MFAKSSVNRKMWLRIASISMRQEVTKDNWVFNNGERKVSCLLFCFSWIWNIDYKRWNINNCCCYDEDCISIVALFFCFQFVSLLMVRSSFRWFIACRTHKRTSYLCKAKRLWGNGHTFRDSKESVCMVDLWSMFFLFYIILNLIFIDVLTFINNICIQHCCVGGMNSQHWTIFIIYIFWFTQGWPS